MAFESYSLVCDHFSHIHLLVIILVIFTCLRYRESNMSGRVLLNLLNKLGIFIVFPQ